MYLHAPYSLVFPPPTITVNKAGVSPWAGRYSHNRLCLILLSNRLHYFQWLKTHGFFCWRSQTYSNNLWCIFAEVWRKTEVRRRDGGKNHKNEIIRIKISMPDYFYDRLTSSLIQYLSTFSINQYSLLWLNVTVGVHRTGIPTLLCLGVWTPFIFFMQ